MTNEIHPDTSPDAAAPNNFERKIPMRCKEKGTHLYKRYEFTPSDEIQLRINALLSDIMAEFKRVHSFASDIEIDGIPVYKRISDI
jgi:hypothetical protein